MLAGLGKDVILDHSNQTQTVCYGTLQKKNWLCLFLMKTKRTSPILNSYHSLE